MKKYNAKLKILVNCLPVAAVILGFLGIENWVSSASAENGIHVKAVWEMNADKENEKYPGADDSADAGAQFMPSGKYEVSKRIAVCAVVSGLSTADDVQSVSGNIFYPEDILFDLGSGEEKQNLGCGKLKKQNQMTKLSKEDGISGFCDKIKNNNNNLLLSQDESLYGYEEICKTDGELEKETAAVFCGEEDLYYDDPAGIYSVKIEAQDKNESVDRAENKFNYLPVTAFEMDFSSIEYGKVKLGEDRIIIGDTVWGNEMPSVRNAGNTRLKIAITQGDAGLGKTDGVWNVKYGTKVGVSDDAWTFYDPEAQQVLQEALNLSEMKAIDFSIFVSKFPKLSQERYNGDITLSAIAEEYLKCEESLPGDGSSAPSPEPNISPAAESPTPSLEVTPLPTIASEATPTPEIAPIPLITPEPNSMLEPEVSPTPADILSDLATSTPSEAPAMSPSKTPTPAALPSPTESPTPILAEEASLMEPTPTASSESVINPECVFGVEPSASPAPEVDASPLPSLEATPAPTLISEVTPTPTPENIPVSSIEFESSPTLEPEVSPTPVPAPTPTPIEEALPLPTPTPTPEPTINPECVSRVEPSASPAPEVDASPIPTENQISLPITDSESTQNQSEAETPKLDLSLEPEVSPTPAITPESIVLPAAEIMITPMPESIPGEISNPISMSISKFIKFLA